MRLYCYFRKSLFPHYCAAVRSSLLNLLKRQLVYILFDGEVSSGYDAVACMPDAKKGRMIKAILERFRRLLHTANSVVVYTQRIGGCSYWVFN